MVLFTFSVSKSRSHKLAHGLMFFSFVRFVLFNFALTCAVVSFRKLIAINFDGNSAIPC